MLTIITVFVIIIAMMPLICHIDIHYIFILHVPYENNNPNWRIFTFTLFSQVFNPSVSCFSDHPLFINRRPSSFPSFLTLFAHFCLALFLLIFFSSFSSFLTHFYNNNSIFFSPVETAELQRVLEAGCDND